jgi:hypothetical protein
MTVPATSQRRRTWVAVVAGALCVLLIWGGVEVVKDAREMQGYGSPSAQEVETALMAMKSRASFEEVRGAASSVLGEIRVALEGEFGSIVWEHDVVETGVLGCTNAESETFGTLSERARSLGSLSLDEAQTERAIDIVSGVAHQNGYTRTLRRTAVSGTQYVDLATERGGRVYLATGDPLGITVSTDCFLIAERLADLQSDD